MALKNLIKNKISIIVGIRRCCLYLKGWFVRPRKLNQFGYIGSHTLIETPSYFTNQKNAFLEDYTKIRAGFNLINDTGKLFIKKYTAIAPNCTIVTGNHTKNVTVPQIIGGTNHVNDKEGDIIIGEDVWIGVNCTILHGASIGRGSVVGACSLINKIFPPYAVLVGSPAKIIASVFSIDQIIEHEKSLYPESERFTRPQLETIFNTYYEGKKSIGNELSQDALKKVEIIKRRMGIPSFSNT